MNTAMIVRSEVLMAVRVATFFRVMTSCRLVGTYQPFLPFMGLHFVIESYVCCLDLRGRKLEQVGKMHDGKLHKLNSSACTITVINARVQSGLAWSTHGRV